MRLLPILLCLLFTTACDLFPKSHLEQIQADGVLRVLTRNSATTYYEGPYGPAGLEYDLAAGFAGYLGVRLDLRVPDSLSEILQEIQAETVAVRRAMTDKYQVQF